MSADPAVSKNPCTSARPLSGPWEVFISPRMLCRGSMGKEETEAYENGNEEVG